MDFGICLDSHCYGSSQGGMVDFSVTCAFLAGALNGNYISHPESFGFGFLQNHWLLEAYAYASKRIWIIYQHSTRITLESTILAIKVSFSLQISAKKRKMCNVNYSS